MSDIDTDDGRDLLTAIHDQAGGDPTVQVSMYEAGRTLGWETDRIERVAQDLMADGLLEFKTLSGGVAVTADGIEQLHPGGSGGAGLRLGPGPQLDEAERAAVEAAANGVKGAFPGLALSHDAAAALVAHLRSLDAQIGAPHPHTGIVRACLTAIREALPPRADAALTAPLRALLGE